MNILEALQAIESGEVVRSEIGKEINFFYQATLWPYGSKEIHRIDTDELNFDEKISGIKDLEDSVDHNFRICLDYLRSDLYRTVTQDEMIEECEKIRAKNCQDSESL